MTGLATPGPTSPAREREAALLSRCVDVARGGTGSLEPADAQVLALAASLLHHRHPAAARALAAASDRLLATQGEPRMPLGDLLRSGRITDLPRFKERLLRQLAAP